MFVSMHNRLKIDAKAASSRSIVGTWFIVGAWFVTKLLVTKLFVSKLFVSKLFATGSLAITLVIASSIVVATPRSARAGDTRSIGDAGQTLTEVGRLIEQLGADSYATRTRAMERLQRMGLEAFDELHQAQYHSDIEIEMAARYLVSSLLVSWSKETDPPEVREALHEYGAQDETERASRIEMLSEFSERRGLEALARLTRFETSIRLSRAAALAILEQPMTSDEASRIRDSALLLQTLGDNQRDASQWLRVYSQDLSSGDYSVDQWRDLIAKQRHDIDAMISQTATRASVLDLVRICALRAIQSGRRDEAMQLSRDHIDLIEPTTRQLVDACTWAIDHELHPFVLDLRSEFKSLFDQQPILLYGAAEAMKVAGDNPSADALAAKALAIQPLPTTAAEKEKASPRDYEDAAQAHMDIGGNLRRRGLFEWAELEYRHVIESIEIDAAPSAIVRGELAAMLGELQRHREVVDVLRPMVERVEKDDKMRQRLNNFFFQLSRTQSDMYFHDALADLKEGKVAEARPKLLRAYSLYDNVDILIAMYRTEGDDQWKATIRSKLEMAVKKSEFNIERAGMQNGVMGRFNTGSPDFYMNEYAWLVSNTEGDFQKALEYSLKSLETDPDSAKYDTCGRCYFAIGDIENALIMQKRALKLDPHSPPMQRQLREFEEARKK